MENFENKSSQENHRSSSEHLSDIAVDRETLLPHFRQEPARRQWSKPKPTIILFLCVFAGGIIGALGSWLLQKPGVPFAPAVKHDPHGHEHVAHFVPQMDIIGFFPEVSHRVTYFEKQPEYISNHSDPQSILEVKKLWEALLPPGEGFLYVTDEEAEKYDFPMLIHYNVPPEHGVPGKPLRGKAIGTTIAHSLHCLYLIMAEYDLVFQGQGPGDGFKHMDHCIDWIRQSLMCAGDVALSGNHGPLTNHEEERDNVVWTISGPKDAVKALGSPAEALESMSKDMKAKTKVEPAAAAQPIVETRDKADDLLMYYNE
ncbi:hypothetical protein PpBr36_02068 [Pyricularia pennisetigena]|uniref:hypothetical protein n=1 Tax=Pyricularia pennisetigena TaxID=1578925 RepID=UPI0011520F47|nr:hypothetical protein PpBr36_02068 [Pyricularia pennisetigena]TLS27898.1 hypothetical protein PpBr36_02068 [Pyricularia pennisetigena]